MRIDSQQFRDLDRQSKLRVLIIKKEINKKRAEINKLQKELNKYE
jgi:hypothetical protein